MACAGTAGATTLPLTAITTNSATSVAQGLAGITVGVTQVAGGVRFDFGVSGSDPMSIAQIYWDNTGGVLGAVSLVDVSGGGVNFVVEASPGNLPGGNTVGFTEHFEVGAAPPPPTNGINPGETLGVEFSLAGASTYADVTAAISTGSLRVGMHVIAFANGQSESYVSGPPTSLEPIPLPSGAALAAAGLGLVALRRRR